MKLPPKETTIFGSIKREINHSGNHFFLLEFNGTPTGSHEDFEFESKEEPKQFGHNQEYRFQAVIFPLKDGGFYPGIRTFLKSSKSKDHCLGTWIDQTGIYKKTPRETIQEAHQRGYNRANKLARFMSTFIEHGEALGEPVPEALSHLDVE